MFTEDQIRELCRTGSKGGISYEELQKYINFCFEAHGNNDITDHMHYRQIGNLPYPVHPMFAAHLLLSDRRVPWKEKRVGTLALILNDVLKGTSAKLPDWVDPEVKKIVEELSFDSHETKHEDTKKKPANIRFLRLVDMLANLYEEAIPVRNQKIWMDTMKWLIESLPEYKETKTVAVAKFLLETTDWEGHRPWRFEKAF
jgi:hypothetical protein